MSYSDLISDGGMDPRRCGEVCERAKLCATCARELTSSDAQINLPAQEWLGYDPERGDIHGYTFDQMREFAQSIIAECCLFVYDSDNIKKHFGIT